MCSFKSSLWLLGKGWICSGSTDAREEGGCWVGRQGEVDLLVTSRATLPGAPRHSSTGQAFAGLRNEAAAQSLPNIARPFRTRFSKRCLTIADAREAGAGEAAHPPPALHGEKERAPPRGGPEIRTNSPNPAPGAARRLAQDSRALSEPRFRISGIRLTFL